MPILVAWALGGTAFVSSAFLIFSKGVDNVGESASNAGNKLIVTAAGALGLYAAYKILLKSK